MEDIFDYITGEYPSVAVAFPLGVLCLCFSLFPPFFAPLFGCCPSVLHLRGSLAVALVVSLCKAAKEVRWEGEEFCGAGKCVNVAA